MPVVKPAGDYDRDITGGFFPRPGSQSAGRFLHAQRYNKFHGKDGKFSSGPGGGSAAKEYTSPTQYRAMEAGVTTFGGKHYGVRPDVDPLNAKDQIDSLVAEQGGLGTWWGPKEMASVYKGGPGSMLVGAKFKPEDFDRFTEDPSFSGVRPPRDATALVTHVEVNVEGTWHVLDVPEGLVAPIARHHGRAGRFLHAQRFNKYHGKDGKFASGPGAGGASGSTLHGWSVEDRASLVKQATDETWALINGPDGADLRATHSQAELETMVADQVAMIVPADPGTTLRKGDMALHLSGGLSADVTDEHKELLVRRMDELMASDPISGKVTVSVVRQANMSAANVRGMTERGSGRIFLSEEIFRDGAQKKDPGFMPSYKDRGVVDYTLTHEWGHARDNLSDSASIEAWGHAMDGVSEYGLFSHREAYAEAFAEWRLTGGKTTNPSARAYAERFGW